METEFMTKRQMAKKERNKKIAVRYLELKQQMPDAPNRVLFDEKNWEGYDLCQAQLLRIVTSEGVYNGKCTVNRHAANADN